MIVGWHDNLRALFGSNMMSVELVTSLSQWDGKTKPRVLTETPNIVKSYN